MNNNEVTLLHSSKVTEGRYTRELKIWAVPPSRHYPDGLSYRLWFGTHTETLVLYDIHHGKPYHVHIRGQEFEYEFQDINTLIRDFLRDTRRFR